LWDTQRCNPGGASRSLPADDIILLYAIPIAAQIVLRNISLECIITMWVIIVAFVLFCMVWMGGYHELWTLLYSILCMNISYKVERWMRYTYLHARETLDARAHQFALLQSQQSAEKELADRAHDLEILAVSAENEKKLREAESFQLRALMVRRYRRYCRYLAVAVGTATLLSRLCGDYLL
jgi:hypothetical protein